MNRTTWIALAAITLLGKNQAIADVDQSKLIVKEFSLSDVQLLDSPFKQNMERNAAYLLSIEPDRLLHNTRKYCGLAPKGEIYGGWESRGIAGHSLGHYLTAISQQYAATGDKRFRDRVDYIIREMAECQRHYGDGYIGALPPTELDTLRGFKDGKIELSGAFGFKNGAWVPWYTEHKILAGLIDAWTLAGNAQAKEVALKLGDFVDKVTAKLTPEQQQHMLGVEHGGMLESMVELYSLTGNQRYLDVSRRFYHHAIFDPLLEGRDELAGKHANTQIPKIIGEARSYEVANDENGRKIAEYFWDRVVHHHSWVIGGNSDGEHFFPEGQADRHLSPATAESCNSYNMLKLTEHLFEWQPRAELADYFERVLYNHILLSQEPDKGMFTYFISLKPGLFKTYSTPFDSFWCCVGTGMENHTKYGKAIYFQGNDKLYVNLFIPSVLTWKDKGLVLEQRTDYPRENTTELTIKSAPAIPIALMVRCPGWAAGQLNFTINGQPLEVKGQPGEYAEISRSWRNGDKLRVTIPMNLHIEKLEDNANKIAFLYGPLVLAGDLGPMQPMTTFPYAKGQLDNARAADVAVPVLVRTGDEDLTGLLQREPGKQIVFHTKGLAKPNDVTLKPFISIPYERYNIYWDVVSAQDWKTREAAMQAENERHQREQARIVDEFNPGEQQSEVDHKFTSQDSHTGDLRDRKWRDAHAPGWFQFEMKVARNTPQVLRCNYWGNDAGREFDVLLDGKQIATQSLNNNKPAQFFDAEYAIPSNLLSGKDKVTIRFEPHNGSVAGGLFHCAVLKAETL